MDDRHLVIENMDPELRVVLKHDRETWHVVPVVVASALNWDRFLAPPYDTSKLRKAVMETVGDFPVTPQIEGYWDGGETEIDIVAINDDDKRIRFGTCKRNAECVASDLKNLDAQVPRFLAHYRGYESYRIEKVALALEFDAQQRQHIVSRGFVAQDLRDLCQGL